MPELDYVVVDVFTDSPLAGNPLAVVLATADPDVANPDAAGLDTERMLAIAREFNLSETTFVLRRAPAIEREEGVRVRIFTTQEELRFAGHPTLGTASVLRMLAPEVFVGDTVALALDAGRVPVRFTGAGLLGEMTQPEATFGEELDRTEVARLICLGADDLHPELPPQVVSTGTSFAIVVLRSLEPLARLRVDHYQATPWLRARDARWFYVLAAVPQAEPGAMQQFRARMQFYGGEDPATGSAAGCAIAYLVGRGAVAGGERVALRQGVEMGRTSDMVLSAQRDSARVADVRVAGSTVLVAKGRLFLP